MSLAFQAIWRVGEEVGQGGTGMPFAYIRPLSALPPAPAHGLIVFPLETLSNTFHKTDYDR